MTYTNTKSIRQPGNLISMSQTHFPVIVAGAGMAGTKAAAVISKAGLNVLVLEARDRLGGRINTERTEYGPYEMGMYIYWTILTIS